MPTDTEILDWLERYHTLHKSVEALYVVDGYEVWVDNDRESVRTIPHVRGETLREAYVEAMKVWP